MMFQTGFYMAIISDISSGYQRNSQSPSFDIRFWQHISEFKLVINSCFPLLWLWPEAAQSWGEKTIIEEISENVNQSELNLLWFSTASAVNSFTNA